MKRRQLIASTLAASTFPVASGCATSPDAAMAPAKANRITVLYDAFGLDPSLQKDWGYSALVEFNGRRVLFDTGNNGDVLARNAAALGADLSSLDFVVMSHRHGDHMGGMSHLLRVNPKVRIYAPKEGFGVYGADLPGAFYRRDESLPPEQRYFGGSPPSVMRFGSAWPQADIVLVDRNTEIAPGLHLISLVSDKPGTLELRELSLALVTPAGMAVVVGCSHTGVDNILREAAAIRPVIWLLAGGFHYVVAKDPDISSLVTTLRDTYKVEVVAPGHCTGEPTFAALQQAYGGRYLYAGLGTRFSLDGSVHAVFAPVPADRRAAYEGYESARADAERRRVGLFSTLVASGSHGASYLGAFRRSMAGCC